MCAEVVDACARYAGQLFVTGSWDGVVKLWENVGPDAKVLQTLFTGLPALRDVGLAPTMVQTVACAAVDGRVRLYDMASQQEIVTLNDPVILGYKPNPTQRLRIPSLAASPLLPRLQWGLRVSYGPVIVCGLRVLAHPRRSKRLLPLVDCQAPVVNSQHRSIGRHLLVPTCQLPSVDSRRALLCTVLL